MKVVGCFRLEDGSTTKDMTANELCELYPDKVEDLTFRFAKRLCESIYPVEIERKDDNFETSRQVS